MTGPVLSRTGVKAVKDRIEEADQPLERLERFIVGHPFEDDMGELLIHVRTARRRLKSAHRVVNRLGR